MKRMGRLVASLVGICLVASSLAGCGGQAPSGKGGGGEPIVIGLVTSMTGGQAASGRHVLNGLTLAVEEWNEKGGINGRPIKLVHEDDASQPSGAVNAFNKLMAQSKPVAVFTPVFSNLVLAMEPYIREAKIPALSGGTNPKITGSGNKWMFRIKTSDDINAKLISEFAVKELKKKKIAILHVTGEYGTSAAAATKANLERLGVKPVEIQSYNIEDKEFSAQLLKIYRSGAELVIAWGYPPDAGLILTQVKQLGLPLTFLAGSGYATQDALNLAKDAANGHYLMMDFIVGSDPKVQEWASKVKAKFNTEANFLTGTYYDGANILFRAIQSAGTEPEALRQAILDTKNYEGIIGTYSFDEKGDSIRQAYFAQVRDGKPVLIKLYKG